MGYRARFGATAGRLAAVLALFVSGSASAHHEFSLSVGLRTMEDPRWDDDMVQLGAVGNVGLARAPLHVTLAAHYAERICPFDCRDNALWEISVGPTLIGGTGRFRPYLGGGVVAVFAEAVDPQRVDRPQRSDESLGYRFSAGSAVRLGTHFMLGVDARYTGGTRLDVFSGGGDADALVASLTFGWTWMDHTSEGRQP